MSDFSIEKKLELVQQVRSQHYRNQSDMMNREQILYGRTSSKRPEYGWTGTHKEYQTPNPENSEEGIFKDNTLMIRFALATVLLVIIILFDKSGHNIGSVSMEQIFTMIEADYVQ